MNIFFQKTSFLPNLKLQNLTRYSSPPAPVSASTVLPHPISISVFSHCSSISPQEPPFLKNTHRHPHLRLMLHSHPSQPAAPCRVKWSVLVSGESCAQFSSAQLSWAASVINLVCDYCQSLTPPPRTSALMGTMSPGTVSRGGRDEGAEEGWKLRRGKGRELLLIGEKNKGSRDWERIERIEEEEGEQEGRENHQMKEKASHILHFHYLY